MQLVIQITIDSSKVNNSVILESTFNFLVIKYFFLKVVSGLNVHIYVNRECGRLG